MQSEVPKQYMLLNSKPIAQYSLDVFIGMEEISEIIIVSEPEFRHFFQFDESELIKFALPGLRRQDSVYNGLKAVAEEADIICIHDSARPFIDESLVRRVLLAGIEHGAATVGMPVKFTIKEADSGTFVAKTPDRTKMWEIQTPQVLEKSLLEKGFEQAIKLGKTVTDDVMLAEGLDHPVKLVEGSYRNVKITTPEDLLFAQHSN